MGPHTGCPVISLHLVEEGMDRHSVDCGYGSFSLLAPGSSKYPSGPETAETKGQTSQNCHSNLGEQPAEHFPGTVSMTPAIHAGLPPNHTTLPCSGCFVDHFDNE